MKKKFKRPSRELRRWKAVQVDLLCLQTAVEKYKKRMQAKYEAMPQFCVWFIQ